MEVDLPTNQPTIDLSGIKKTAAVITTTHRYFQNQNLWEWIRHILKVESVTQVFKRF